MLTRRTALRGTAAVLAAPLAAPALIRAARADDTIKVGVTNSVTGPAAESGRLQLNGARQALEEVNKKGVLGKKLELVVEDDQTTNPGSVLAFSRLAGREDIVAFIGSVRSTQVHAMAPDVAKTGKPMMMGGTDPTLTQIGNPWLFRCRPNDTYSARVLAAFGVDELKKTKWALVHSTDAFGSNGNKALVDSLKAKGIEPVLDQGYTNQQADFTPVVLAVKSAGADIVASYFTFENDLGVFARQLRQLGVNIPWVGSPSITNTTALNLAGRSLFGTYGVADFTTDATPASKAFSDRYQQLYKAIPDNQSSWTFDAVNILAKAIEAAGGTEPGKLREAILGVRGYAGAEGEYNFDTKGDGLHGYNIVKNEGGKIVFVRRVDMQT